MGNLRIVSPVYREFFYNHNLLITFTDIRKQTT